MKPVSRELATQLGEVLGREQGLVVEQITEGSAAAKLGIRQYDILATYDDQKLFSVAQFMKLVHADKPGRLVSLGIIRGAKKMNFELTLGERKPHTISDRTRSIGSNRRRGPVAPPLPTPPASSRPKADWDRFQSLGIQKSGPGRLKVTVRHVDEQGQVKQHDFQGTPAEISRAMRNDSSFPAGGNAYLPSDLYQPNDIYQPEQAAVPLPPLSQVYTGYFVDAGNGAITIQEEGGDVVTFQLAPGAVIIRNGQAARLQDLTSTDIATLTEENTLVTKVTARSVDPYSGSAKRSRIPDKLRTSFVSMEIDR